MRITLTLLFIAMVPFFTGCGSLRPSDFAEGRPKLDPTEYFAGRTRSTGVIENRRGHPTHTVTTTTQGFPEPDGRLRIEQDLVITAPGTPAGAIPPASHLAYHAPGCPPL